MIKSIMTNWSWYAAVLVIIGPFLFVLFMEPDWLARLLGNGLFLFGLPLYGLWYALGPWKNLGIEGRIMWPDYITKRFGDKVYIGTRVLVFGLVSIMLYLLTIPFAGDVVNVVQGEAPLREQGTVTYISGSSVAGYISQDIVFDNKNSSVPENRFHAWFFLVGQIKYGNAYEFFYLPDSKIILDVKSTSSQ